LRVLVVEDNADDAALLVAQLAGTGRAVAHRRVDTAMDMKEALLEAEWDVVISDHVMPCFSSSEALHVLRQSGRSIPFIIYSGCISEQIIAAARREGISSCISKGETGQLVPAIERELRECRREHARPEGVNLLHLADYDRITGLPGRALFLRQAEARLAVARDSEHVAVCFIDLARFMRVNQTFGYDAADQVLAQIARRLKTASPESLVSRLAGDKFAVICGGFHVLSEVRHFAERLIAMLGESFTHEGLQLHLASSMGVSVYPEDGATPAELILHAETAMFQCKKLLGRIGFLFYFNGMDRNVGRELALESALWDVDALTGLFLLYQPIVALGSGKVITMEALARWQHPVLGLLPPGRFMPLAEKAGLMGRIGAWALTEACRQARVWQDAGVSELGVSVNIAPSQFAHPALPAQVEQALGESRLDPRRLTLEIAGSVLMPDVTTVRDILYALRQTGAQLAIDDFGISHSSVGALKHHVVDVLKIDRSFVDHVATDTRDAVITGAVIAMGRSLGLVVTAGGVDTPAQAEFLRAQGCDCAQGLLFSAPISAADVPGFIAGHAVDNFARKPA